MAKPPAPNMEVVQALNDLGSTVNVLEDRYRTLRKKIKVTDEALMTSERSMNKELSVVSEDLAELKAKITKLSELLGQAFQDSQNLVKRHEFLELKKYVEFWNPMDFVQKKEVTQHLNKSEK
jgi:anion-transporting  ArsA/GET3 family ATPase